MNPIPSDEELENYESFLYAMFKERVLRDSNGNEIFPEESPLEKLDRKYAPLFKKLEETE